MIKPPKGKQCDVLSMDPGGGHIVVLGTAGSGKTMMAILRSQYLADPATDHAGKTLLVTYNKALVNYLKAYAADELKNVVVETFHRFALGYLRHRNQDRSIVGKGERTEYIAAAIERCGFTPTYTKLGLKKKILVELLGGEFGVIRRSGLENAEQLAASPLPSKNPKLYDRLTPEQVFQLLETYVACRDSGEKRYDWDDVLTAAYNEMKEDDTERMFRHVVIDEGQDFAPVMLRTLALAVPKRNGTVTFFGDVAQQIYGRVTSWRDAGLTIKEPIFFKQNYRNTLEIAQLGLAISKMPYYSQVPDMVAPQSPTDAGPKPTLVELSGEEAEIGFVVTQARNAVDTESVAILCATTDLAALVMSKLKEVKEKRVVALDRSSGWKQKPRIYVGTYHAGKGLEFGSVILPFCSRALLPIDWVVEVHGQEDADSSTGSLLYVGVTRARRNLIITHSGKPSRLLPTDDNLYLRVKR